MIRSIFSAAGLVALGLVIGSGAKAQAQPISAPSASILGGEVFQLPRLAAGLRRFRELLGRGDAGAGEMLDQLIATFPRARVLQAAQAILAGSSEAADEGAARALAALGAPVRAACPTAEPAGLETTIPGDIEPALVSRSSAPVTSDNTGWNLRLQRLQSEFLFPPILSRKPIAAPGVLPAHVLRTLQTWYVRGQAAGLDGIAYDNRDRGHSRLSAGDWPQLSFTRYSDAARAAELDYGLNNDLLFGAVTFGNSSTALVGGPLWRSQARLALTVPDGPERLFQLYAHDHVYVFPEHRDHDPVETGGRGDLFPANTPYYFVSQGSSGSDRPILRAIAAILAAMKPEVQAFLDGHDLVAPTVQMVFRRGLRGIGGAEAYMSGGAHPTVFRAEDIDLDRMIGIAQALEADTVPPMTCLEVVQRTRPVPRSGIFADGLSETLFETPSAVALVWRSTDSELRLRISAGATEDPNGRALRFHWRVLRGDPGRVMIEPLDEAGSTADISIGWHEGGEVTGSPGLDGHRVDIAVFADNGAMLSAPAFISVLFPADQRRIYETGPDGTRRPVEIDYADPARAKRYSDPLLFPRRDWRDRYRYDAEGRLLGWTRARHGIPDEAFTRHGLRVLTRDRLGRPERAEEVAYPVASGERGRLQVTPTPTGRVQAYAYSGEHDRLGVPVPDTRSSSD